MGGGSLVPMNPAPGDTAAADRNAPERRAGTRGMPRSLREQLILRVAGEVFADGGYDRASMDRIADLAGVSKPMLYAYFGSKEGLYVAYIERTGGELVQRLVNADKADSGTGRLRGEIVSEVRRMLEGDAARGRPGPGPPESEGVAEAIVGAGEALANWWLKKPGVAREDVADWYVDLARAAISAATRQES